MSILARGNPVDICRLWLTGFIVHVLFTRSYGITIEAVIPSNALFVEANNRFEKTEVNDTLSCHPDYTNLCEALRCPLKEGLTNRRALRFI